MKVCKKHMFGMKIIKEWWAGVDNVILMIEQEIKVEVIFAKVLLVSD